MHSRPNFCSVQNYSSSRVTDSVSLEQLAYPLKSLVSSTHQHIIVLGCRHLLGRTNSTISCDSHSELPRRYACFRSHRSAVYTCCKFLAVLQYITIYICMKIMQMLLVLLLPNLKTLFFGSLHNCEAEKCAECCTLPLWWLTVAVVVVVPL